MLSQRRALDCFAETSTQPRGSCSLDELFEEYNVRLPDTSSGSAVVMGTLREDALLQQCWKSLPRQVALKVYYAYSPRKRRVIEVEVELYKVMNELFLDYWTPHVVLYVDDWQCGLGTLFSDASAQLRDKLNARKQRVRQTSGKERRKAQQQLEALAEFLAVPQSTSARVIMLERGEADVYTWIESGRLTSADLNAILFQVVWSLYIFDRIGLRHGDLHPGNVLVDFTSAVQTIAYVPQPSEELAEYYELSSRFMSKIFDWDWGGIYGGDGSNGGTALANPKARKHCATMSTCGRNAKADLYTFLSAVHAFARGARFLDTRAKIAEIIDPELLEFAPRFKDFGGEKHRLCRGPLADDCSADFLGEQCAGAWEPPDCLVLSPLEALAILAPTQKRLPRKPSTKEVYGYFMETEERERFI